jgi:SatD family (SatD)
MMLPPVVVTIDQRASRAAESQAEQWAKYLNAEYSDSLVLPFALTVGDEIQGVMSSAEAVVDIALAGVRSGAWWLGLGLGGIDAPFPDSAPQGRGPAFYAAREAVEKAKRSPYGFAIRSFPNERGQDAQTVLELLGFVIRRRGSSEKRWQAIELARQGASTVRIGKLLGITQQAASKRLRNAGFDEEMAGRRLAAHLIERAVRGE